MVPVGVGLGNVENSRGDLYSGVNRKGLLEKKKIMRRSMADIKHYKTN